MLEKKYEDLLYNSSENEILEFKSARNNFSKNDLGKYFSALSNEARLAGEDNGWLILGVNDPKKYRNTETFIVGTQFKKEKEAMNKIKYEVSSQINNNLSFSEVTEKIIEDKRVLIFGIPAALPNVPTTFQDKPYGRTGESLDILSPLEMKRLYNQNETDWSKEIVPGSSIDDLDKAAINLARQKYQEKNPKLADEVDTWSNEVFLNKAKITLNSQITNAALILLGKLESTALLDNARMTISWILKDENNIELDYEHFSAPVIFNIDNVYSKIRNLNYRYMPDDSLFPTEIRKYDSYVLREALNNAIAHQDYRLNGKINLGGFYNELSHL